MQDVLKSFETVSAIFSNGRNAYRAYCNNNLPILLFYPFRFHLYLHSVEELGTPINEQALCSNDYCDNIEPFNTYPKQSPLLIFNHVTKNDYAVSVLGD